MPARGISKLTSTLPASWYTHQGLYELERRAIFSKSWLLATHQCRIPDPGNYVRYTIAGYPFFLVRNQHGEIGAFLNACRHRAFPVVQKDEGKVNNLICKFHGWTFDLEGRLVKAPHFDQVNAFRKCDHSLWKLHTTIDRNGFVYINLDSSETPTKSWVDQFGTADVQPRLRQFDMTRYRYDHSRSFEHRYNWKTFIDNFNECYHCSVAHPSIASYIKLEKYRLKFNQGAIEHHVGVADVKDDTAITYLFPNSAITMTQPYFYLMRVSPIDATSVSMQYEVYRDKETSEEEFQEYDEFFKQIEHEDQQLCVQTQINLSAGTFVAGPLHPEHEIGVLQAQQLVKSAILDHRRQESQSKCLVEPARRLGQIHENTLSEDGFCANLLRDEYFSLKRIIL